MLSPNSSTANAAFLFIRAFFKKCTRKDILEGIIITIWQMEGVVLQCVQENMVKHSPTKTNKQISKMETRKSKARLKQRLRRTGTG